MNIGFYNEPTNLTSTNYKGLYRQSSLIDFLYSEDSATISSINWYFSISKQGNYVENFENYTHELFELRKCLTANGWNGDVILFTDEAITNINPEYKFLGYDICTECKYYSPLGDGFLNQYDPNDLFFSSMSYAEFKYFEQNINNNGLFTSHSVALQFSEYCNIINSKYEHVIESENGWKPFSIYIQELM